MMGIRAGDILRFAKAIRYGQGDSAELRTVVSRAYYAAYHAWEPFARRLSAGTGGTGMHQRFCQRFLEHPTAPPGDPQRSADLRIRGLGIKLDRLRRERNLADYDLDMNYTPTKAREILAMAEKLVGESASPS